VPELVPLRYGRMLVSPFTFYRGAALIMASDLANTPRSGLTTQLCGDAHLMNFGVFAAPDRRLVFDMNDFDETLPGPWEWDVKRLVASFAIAGRDNGYSVKDRRSVLLTVAGAYRSAMRQFAEMSNLDVWYTRLDAATLLAQMKDQIDRRAQKRTEATVAKARTRDSMQALDKLTRVVDGDRRIISDPPLIQPVEQLVSGVERDDIMNWLRALVRRYRGTLQSDRRHLLEDFRLVHAALKVVGVGSVGTRCWIALMLGRDDTDPLFLQIKEAEASVLEAHAGRSGFANHGQRVVEGQRLLQAASDIMLGWTRTVGLDGVERDYYVRQLWDGKFSAVIETMTASVLDIYARLCGWTLARGHARSGDRLAISAYLGSNDSFDRAMAEFSTAYADQNEADYASVAATLQAAPAGPVAPAVARS
jgi:uncharacterized protein (DUF2252 family)